MELQWVWRTQFYAFILLIILLHAPTYIRCEEEIVCGSTDIRNEVSNFYKIENCSIIEGSLQILLIDRAQPSDYAGLSFPKLRMITDYLFLFRVKNLFTLRDLFPNLTVIRGDSLFYNYALIIFEMFEMQDIGLPSLTALKRGWIRLEKNINLCYISTLDLSLIQVEQGTDNNFFKGNKDQEECFNFCPERDGKRLCHKATPNVEVTELCWTGQDCQRVCPAECPQSCSLINDDACCHKECIGGCYGPYNTSCVACKNFYHQGMCLPKCPEGYYEYKNWRCIPPSQCQNGWKLFKKQCIEACPANFMEDVNNRTLCLPCNGTCPKVCGSRTIYSVEDAAVMEGCTQVNGTLTISIHGTGTNVVNELEKRLGQIEVITGALLIRRANTLVSLNFLKKLRRIDGETDSLEGGQYSLYVLANNNLQQLFDTTQHPNITIANGKFFFHFNPKLCYSEIEKFHRRVGLKDPLQKNDVSQVSNGDQVACNTHRLSLNFLPSFGGASMVMLSWSKPTGDGRDVVGFIVSYREAPYRNITELDGEDACGTSQWEVQYEGPDQEGTIIINLKPWTQYAFMVRTYTIAGAQFSARSDIAYYLTEEAKPSVPSQLHAMSNSSSELMVTWKPPVHPNGNLTHYKISWTRQLLAKEQFDKRDFCREKLPNLITSKTEPNETPLHEDANSTLVGGECCACPPDPEELQREKEEKNFQKLFEDTIHNHVYTKRPDSKRRKKRQAVEEQSTAAPNATTTPPTSATESSSGGTQNTSVTPSTGSSVSPNATTTPSTVVEEREIGVREMFHMMALEHFTEYFIQVSACNKRGCSQAAAIYARTLPKDSADQIESDVQVNVSSTNKVHVSWQAPDKPNGIIIIHEIMIDKVVVDGDNAIVGDERDVYTVIEPETTPAFTTQATQVVECVSAQVYRNSLGAEYQLPVGNYTARVRAISLAGEGPWTEAVRFDVPEEERMNPTDETDATLSPMMGVTIAVSIAAVIIIIFIIIVFMRWHYRRDQMPDGVLYASVNPEYMSTSDMYVADEWEFPRDKLEIIRELGKGSFGMVYEGLAKGIIPDEGISQVAIKSVQANASMRDRIEFLNEASVMKLIDTHHVVRLLGVVSKGQPTYVIMEFMAQGDLKNWLRARRPENQQDLPLIDRKAVPTLEELINMAAEIADGMAYLAARKYVHRDLSARNCLVSEEGTCKVADFGLARDIYQSDYYRKERGGMLPIRWMAPESVKDGVFQTSSDVWSYGILLWEMSTLGELPYQGLSNEEAGEYIKGGNVLRPPDPCPEKLREIMRGCWEYQEKHRYTFGEILLTLQATHLLRDTFADLSFFFTTQLLHQGGGAEEETPEEGMTSIDMERVSILERNASNTENLYTNMNSKKGNATGGGGSNGTSSPVGGSGDSSHASRNGSVTGNGSIPHGKSPVGKCTEC